MNKTCYRCDEKLTENDGTFYMCEKCDIHWCINCASLTSVKNFKESEDKELLCPVNITICEVCKKKCCNNCTSLPCKICHLYYDCFACSVNRRNNSINHEYRMRCNKHLDEHKVY
jgi:hypothetical protein